ncbi:MAG: c-type cytochrome domain-containing protein, partial [Bacteroidota bacterium]|nr:c-type cytochrome domain-containing protein [Bacteroidota bacterium]
MSCHNSGKAKGGLVLDNPDDILKGGKNGKPFVALHADSSLIIQRIKLPEDEKKHMPLTGKPQLTADEMNIIYRWIQSGADFKKKLIELPVTDSLRITASKYLAPPEEEKYDFASADEKTIKGLSNNYRVVYPLAAESPALVVDFYNKKQFTSKSLEDLLVLKKQIVDLNLNKMPVVDADLKNVAQMENLRTLDLAFTNITANGLAQLTMLKYLKSLSLAGDKIDKSAIASLGKIKSLKEVFVWDTGLTGDEIAQWQKANNQVQFVEGFKQTAPMQLNLPIMVTAKSVFTDSMHISLRHPIPGVQIRYTLDGSGPDSSASPLYSDFVAVDKDVMFKARAFKATWLGSDTITYNFYKSAYRPDSIGYISLPDDSYKGDGPNTLSDHLIGDFNTGSGRWQGFQKDMKLLLKFEKLVKLSSVGLHFMKNSGSDIFPPVQVEIWGGNDQSHLRLLKTVTPKPMVKGENASLCLQECKFPPTSVRFIKVIAVNNKKLPKWSNSPNKPGWVFTDEIMLN